jgi:hypothetical protein
LLSYRLDRQQHPIAADSRVSLLRLGLSSSAARTDVPPLRRVVFAGWFVAMALVPRRLVGLVARPFVRVDESSEQRQSS